MKSYLKNFLCDIKRLIQIKKIWVFKYIYKYIYLKKHPIIFFEKEKKGEGVSV